MTALSIAGVFLQNPVQLWSPDDLGERLQLDWNSDFLSDGLVPSWVDAIQGVAATQATSSSQPTKSAAAGGVQFLSGTKQLFFGNQSDPTRFHRAIVIVFQADISSATNGSGCIFSCNGSSGSSDNRAPYVGYSKGSPNTMSGQWATTSTVSVTAGDNTNWHVYVCRRVNGVNMVSIDGGTEVTGGTNALIPRNVTNGLGIIGDFRAATVPWTCYRIMVLQDEMSSAERDKFHGWGLWKKGNQAALPGGHTYASAAPKTSRWINPHPYSSSAEYDAVVLPYFTNNLKDNYGLSISGLKSGLSQVFMEDFNSLTAIDDEAAAPGGTATFFGPVIDGSGGSATCLSPTSGTASVFSYDGASGLTITMQKVGATWYTGTLVSHNIDGRGYTIDPTLGPIFIEAKVKFGIGNGQTMWGAPVWVEPSMRFYNCTTPYEETDICETYNSEVHTIAGANNHVTHFLHDALRHYPGRITHSKQNGQDFFLDVAHSWPGAPVSTYDGNYHTFQMYRNKSFTIIGMDDIELGRWPVLPYMLQPLSLITSLNQNPNEVASASGTYTMTIDYIKVLQGTYP